MLSFWVRAERARGYYEERRAEPAERNIPFVDEGRITKGEERGDEVPD